jgi:peptidyl-prolyl cis-trans isomerase SurA
MFSRLERGLKTPTRLFRIGFLTCSLAIMFAGPSRVLAAATDDTVQRIAAVVNDGVISEYDLEQRLSLAISTMGVANSSQTRKQLRPRVLDNLISEKLQVQEAREQEIEIEMEEVDETIESLSRQNDRTLAEFVDLLEDGGITLKTLAEQVSADLMWRKLVRVSFIPRISDEEVDRIIAQREASKGQDEYDIAEIVVTVEKAENRPKALKSANRLLTQLRRGAQFPVVARQFSEGSTAANGGDVGWVQVDQLPKELAKEVGGMTPGEVSAPIFANGAYYILLLKESRQILGPDVTLTELHLRQIFFDLPENSTDQRQMEVKDLADIVRGSITSCSDIDSLVGDGGASRTADLGRILMGELPPQVRAVVKDLEVGIPSDAIRTPKEVLLMVVCDRKDPPDQAPTKDSIAQRLHERRMAMMARRYLRDLHRDAIIDIR